MEEIWKDIKGFNAYQVSTFGRVRKNGRVLTQCFDGRGYLIIGIKDNNGRQHTKKIHHLVWDTFGDEQRDGHKRQVDHINNISTDNRFANLRLVTASQNSIKRSSLKSKSSRYPNVNSFRDDKWEMSIMRDRKRYRKSGFLTETEAFLYRQKLLLTIGESIF
jgi:hypothetical protein